MTDWNDKEEVLKAVSENGYELENASDELKADREIVLAAVQNDGRALQYASEELKADREIVMAAVQNDGDAIGYASDELKGAAMAFVGQLRQILGIHCCRMNTIYERTTLLGFQNCVLQ